jgi:hypothetical protein
LPELYLYIVHGRNTAGRGFLNGRWLEATDRTEGSASDARLAQLARIFPISEYAAIMDALQPPLVVH